MKKKKNYPVNLIKNYVYWYLNSSFKVAKGYLKKQFIKKSLIKKAKYLEILYQNYYTTSLTNVNQFNFLNINRSFINRNLLKSILWLYKLEKNVSRIIIKKGSRKFVFKV